jgi:hypothetical protein
MKLSPKAWYRLGFLRDFIFTELVPQKASGEEFDDDGSLG